MPKLVYTQAKGVFESGDSLSGFSISDRAVTQESKPVDTAAISYIRLYQQKTGVGDDYLGLEDTTIFISDGNGTQANFEFNTDNVAFVDESGSAVEVDVSGVVGQNVSAGGGVADLLLAEINTAFTGGKLFAVKGSAVDGNASADPNDDTSDYVDITIYAQVVGKPISISVSQSRSQCADNQIRISINRCIVFSSTGR